jgi:hypothetical protein
LPIEAPFVYMAMPYLRRSGTSHDANSSTPVCGPSKTPERRRHPGMQTGAACAAKRASEGGDRGLAKFC